MPWSKNSIETPVQHNDMATLQLGVYHSKIKIVLPGELLTCSAHPAKLRPFTTRVWPECKVAIVLCTPVYPRIPDPERLLPRHLSPPFFLCRRTIRYCWPLLCTCGILSLYACSTNTCVYGCVCTWFVCERLCVMCVSVCAVGQPTSLPSYNFVYNHKFWSQPSNAQLLF